MEFRTRMLELLELLTHVLALEENLLPSAPATDRALRRARLARVDALVRRSIEDAIASCYRASTALRATTDDELPTPSCAVPAP